MTTYEKMKMLSSIREDLLKVHIEVDLFHELYKKTNVQNTIILNDVYENGSKNIVGAKNKLITEVENFSSNHDMLKTIDVFKNFSNKVEEYIAEVGASKKNNALIDISMKLNELTTKIYEYIRKRDKKLIFSFILCIGEVYHGLESLRLFIDNLLQEVLDDSVRIDDGYSEITLSYTMTSNNLEDYFQYLETINIVYNNVCNIIGVNITDETQLKVIKIESGSWFEKLFGLEKVIELVTYIIKKVVDTIFRKFTMQGKIATLQQLQELINTDAELIGKYKEIGVNIEARKKDIELMHVMMVKSLQKMTQKTTGISINGIQAGIDKSIQEKYLRENKRLMIEDKK